MLEQEYWGDPSGNIRRMSGDQEIIATATSTCNSEEWNALCSIGVSGHSAKCNRPPEWLIQSSGDSTTATYSCTQHAGEMLDDSREHLITPYKRSGEQETCCFISSQPISTHA